MINSFKGKSFKLSILGITIISLILVIHFRNPKSEDNIKTQSNNYQGVVENFLNQKNLKIVVNSGATEDIQLPSDFKAIKDGFKIGDLLKQRNELSKQDNLDFSKYMGQRIKLFTAKIETYNSKLNYNVVILISGNKVVGHWIDAGINDPMQNRTDFNILVNIL